MKIIKLVRILNKGKYKKISSPPYAHVHNKKILQKTKFSEFKPSPSPPNPSLIFSKFIGKSNTENKRTKIKILQLKGDLLKRIK